MRSRCLPKIFLILAVLAVSALAVECVKNIDCPAGYECVAGNCTHAKACRSYYDCPGGKICVGGYCVLSFCREDADCIDGYKCKKAQCMRFSCSIDAHCADGQECVNNICAYPCITDPECDFDEHCEAGYCIPVTGVCGYPSNHHWVDYECCIDIPGWECAFGKTCVGHNCTWTIACDSNNDCPNDFYCSGGVCRLVPAGSDCGERLNHRWIGYECCQDESCADDYYCNAYFHQCAAVPEGSDCGERINHTWINYECCEHTDCNASQRCMNHACTEFNYGCLTNADCAEGQRCENNYCVAPDQTLWIIIVLLAIIGAAGALWYFKFRRREEGEEEYIPPEEPGKIITAAEFEESFKEK